MVGTWCRRHRNRQEAERATVTPVPSSRTANRRHAPGRDSAPRRPKGTEHGQEQGGGERVEQRHGPEDSSLQGGQHGVLFSGRRWGCAGRPATPLVEVRPQPGVLRHTAEQIIETFVPVQVLDTPVPQLGTRWLNSCRRSTRRLTSWRSPCPRSLWIGLRSALCDVVHARENSWVEVPTIVSFSSLQQRVAEQIIDIPAQGRGDRGGGGGGREAGGEGGGERGSSRFTPRTVQQRVLWSRPLTFQLLMVVVDGGGHGGLQSVSQGQGSTAFSGTDLVDIPAPHGRGLQGFLPGQAATASSSHSPGAVDEAFTEVFRTLRPNSKKCEVGWAGFRPLRVCMRFLELHMGRPVRRCAYGDWCTFAHSWAELQPGSFSP